jgi:hypothetical protein
MITLATLCNNGLLGQHSTYDEIMRERRISSARLEASRRLPGSTTDASAHVNERRSIAVHGTVTHDLGIVPC